MNIKSLIKIVKQYLDYDPDTGIFVWKLSLGRAKAGSVAGCVCKTGSALLPRRIIYLKGVRYRASHLAYILTHGKYPKGEIDHEDHDTMNDRAANLRDVPTAVNAVNKSLIRSNKSGVMGVNFTKQTGRWRAYIWSGNIRVHLGYFATFNEAVTARKKAEVEYGYHPNHGMR